MELRCEVNQAVAFRKGVNTTSRTCQLHVDPAQLTEEQRALIAERLNDAGDVCSRDEKGLYRYDNTSTPVLPQRWQGRTMRLVRADGADLEALLAAITAENAAYALAEADRQAKAKSHAAEVRAATLTVLDERRTTEKYEHLYAYEVEGRVELSDRRPYNRDMPYGAIEVVRVQPHWPYQEADTEVMQSPAVLVWLAELEARNQVAMAEAEREVRARLAREIERAAAESAEEAAREQEETEMRARRQAQIDAWVSQYGTPNQVSRYQEGLLPEAEVVHVLRDEAFTALADAPLYQRLKASEVCTCDYGDVCKVEFESGPAESLTAAQYDQLVVFRTRLPEAVVTPRLHEGKGRDCEGLERRLSLHVEVTVGAFTFTREYALD